MRGTDWLRRKAAARKPASGGIVRIKDAPPIVMPTGYLMPTAKTTPAEVTLTVDNRSGSVTTPAGPTSTGIVRIERESTALDVARIAEQIQTAFELRPVDGDEPLRCPCVAIYSEYRCTHTNISDATKTADFHANRR